MTWIDKTVQELLTNDISKKRLRLNGKYICEFASNCFSEFAEDANSPRRACYADVIAYDDSRFRKLSNGKVCISFDPDLGDNGMHSMTLRFEDNGIQTAATVIECIVEDTRVQVKDFMKLISFKPNDDADEPYDNLGLTVCSFKKHAGLEPHIEFGIDGRLYYEVLDMNNYEDGSVIPLDSGRRHDVISYVKLTPENIKDIADKINSSLHKVYNEKGKRQ